MSDIKGAVKTHNCSISSKMDFWTWMGWDEDGGDWNDTNEWDSRSLETKNAIIAENKQYVMQLMHDPTFHFGDCTNHAITCGFCCVEDLLKRYREYFFDTTKGGGDISITPDPCVVSIPTL